MNEPVDLKSWCLDSIRKYPGTTTDDLLFDFHAMRRNGVHFDASHVPETLRELERDGLVEQVNREWRAVIVRADTSRQRSLF